MQVDTVKLRSPYLDECTAVVIASQAVTRSATDNATGELLYELTTDELHGLHDHRISLRLHREEWHTTYLQPAPGSARRRPHTYLRPCDPYLTLEGSLTKALLGHNVTNGPSDLLAASRWLLDHASHLLDTPLPPAPAWMLRRLDLAARYCLPQDAIPAYLHGLRNASYPNRKTSAYANEAIYAAGSTTTAKLYHKLPEFLRHDLARLRRTHYPEDYLSDLYDHARQTLRAEVAIKAVKLDRLYPGGPTLAKLDLDGLRAIHTDTVARLVREGQTDMDTVRTTREVRDRLHHVYSRRLASALFATWMQFAALGEDATRDTMARATYFLHRRQLQDAGVSWHGSDLRITEGVRLVPPDFAPLPTDPRYVRGEDPRVTELLAPYRAVA